MSPEALTPPQPLDLSDRAVRAAVLALQLEAFQEELRWMPELRLPPPDEDDALLATCGEVFRGVWAEGGALVGVVSWQVEGAELELKRLMVARTHLRRGVGRALLRSVEVAEPGVRGIKSNVAEPNRAAARLYERAGFRPRGREMLCPGVWLVHLEKPLHPPRPPFTQEPSR